MPATSSISSGNALKIPPIPGPMLVIPDLRSAYNVGSLFRTADAAGIKKIFLCGSTPCPMDKFGRARKDISKTALGAEKTIPWEYCKSAGVLLKKLKKAGVFIIAIEQSKGSVDHKKVKIGSGRSEKPAAFMVGNEVKGLSSGLLKYVDVVAEIPMKGEKESLNVSVAAGVAIFRILGI